MGKGGENSCPAGVTAEQQLVNNVNELYKRLIKLESLHPSTAVNNLFTQLVLLCTPPSAIDVRALNEADQEMRSKLICLCGEAEGLLEIHYSAILGRFPDPVENLSAFPYYNNYRKLARLEFGMMMDNGVPVPEHLAFVGSGPLPLTTLVLATEHMPSTRFHNYDLDPVANAVASRLVAARPELSQRMAFHTCNVMDAAGRLPDYEVVFLAALVGMDTRGKTEVIRHLAEHMAPGAFLLLRSAHGARGFLYPVVDVDDLRGFHVISVVHPTDEIINSVILARKC